MVTGGFFSIAVLCLRY